MIDSINFVKPSYPVKFKGNEDVHSFEGEKEGMKTSTKVAIGTGLAALASVGIYLATKGKKGVGIIGKPELPEGLSHLDMDLFKQFGKFENGGKAILNGNPYTGTLYTKNGCEISYSNGVLTRSKSPEAVRYYDSNGRLYSIDHNYRLVGQTKQTVVERGADGTVTITRRPGGYDNRFMDARGGYLIPANERHEIITTIKPDGTVTRLTQNKERFVPGLQQKFTYDKLENLNTGRVQVTKKGVEFYENGGSFKRQRIVDGKKVTEQLNDKGEVIKYWTTQYNPKTGVYTRQEFGRNGVSIGITIVDKQGHNMLVESLGDYTLYCGNQVYNLGTSKDTVLEFIEAKGLPFEI